MCARCRIPRASLGSHLIDRLTPDLDSPALSPLAPRLTLSVLLFCFFYTSDQLSKTEGNVAGRPFYALLLLLHLCILFYVLFSFTCDM
jgi:hypothetical protein